MVWPSIELHSLLSGAIRWDQASDSVRSWARLALHEGACEICTLDSKEARAMALGRIPETLRPLVQEEVSRIWPVERAAVLRRRGL